MSINPVIEAVQAAFNLEIANQFTVTDNTLTITLPDHTRLLITAEPVSTPGTPTPAAPHQSATSPDTHTYHYLHQHDFDSGATDARPPLGRLLLHNLAECQAYLDDVCHSFLVANIRDNEITFPDGTAYLMTINYAQ